MPLALALNGCGQKHEENDGHGHGSKAAEAKEAAEGHDDHGGEASGASYQEGKGIGLSDETQKSLGLKLAEVGERPVWPSAKFTAQIYRSANEASRTYGAERSGNAYATALISREFAGQLKMGQKLTFVVEGDGTTTREGKVWKIDAAQMDILGKAEALLELPDPQKTLAVGNFVDADVPIGKTPQKLVSIPHSAVLDTANGKYVFVKNGDFLLRTAVKTGAKSSEYTEVTEGLYEGDAIVVEPVEALYLIELRATKGGGHSH